MASMGRVFDLEAAAPLTSMILSLCFCSVKLNQTLVFTRFTSDATAAFVAPVTEVAFFTVPNSAREDARNLIENDVLDSTHPVLTVGKSSGGAIGWGELSPAMCSIAPAFAFVDSLTIVQCLIRRMPVTRFRTGSRWLSMESLDMPVSTITSSGGKPQSMPKSSKRWHSHP